MGMNKAFKRGLGIGCGVMLLVLLAIVGGGTWYAVKLNKDYKAVEASEKALIAATVGLGEYVPPKSGVPGPDRLEIFATVREDMAERRAGLARASQSFATEQSAGKRGSLPQFLRVLSSGSELAPVYAGFWQARNRILQERGMGPEEYIYLYCLIYYSWLGRSPADAEISDRIGADEAGRAINKLMVPIMSRVIDGLGESPDPDVLAGSEFLMMEYMQMISDPDRYPWPQGLPAAMAAEMEPFRLRLEAAYEPSVNPVELMFNSVFVSRVEVAPG